MTSFRIRPRFRQIRQEDPVTIEREIKEKLKGRQREITGVFIPGHITLRIHPDHRHFWSPQLTLSLESTDDGMVINGLYGPNPTVWAVFFLGYATLGIILLIAGMLLLSQQMLGIEAPLWWIIPACIGAGLLLYLIAQAGQKIGASQMYDLHYFYQETMGEKVRIS